MTIATAVTDAGADQAAAEDGEFRWATGTILTGDLHCSSGGVGHPNVIWKPREQLGTGIELMWGTRENADGADGDATRIETMVKYGY